MSSQWEKQMSKVFKEIVVLERLLPPNVRTILLAVLLVLTLSFAIDFAEGFYMGLHQFFP